MSAERGDPDYLAATLILCVSTVANVMRRAGVNYEIAERIGMLSEELHKAIAYRGARVGELIEAVRGVRRHGSILDDLPFADTVRAKPPMPRGDV